MPSRFRLHLGVFCIGLALSYALVRFAGFSGSVMLWTAVVLFTLIGSDAIQLWARRRKKAIEEARKREPLIPR